jgi:hypothetical protein
MIFHFWFYCISKFCTGLLHTFAPMQEWRSKPSEKTLHAIFGVGSLTDVLYDAIFLFLLMVIRRLNDIFMWPKQLIVWCIDEKYLWHIQFRVHWRQLIRQLPYHPFLVLCPPCRYIFILLHFVVSTLSLTDMRFEKHRIFNLLFLKKIYWAFIFILVFHYCHQSIFTKPLFWNRAGN